MAWNKMKWNVSVGQFPDRNVAICLTARELTNPLEYDHYKKSLRDDNF